MDKYSLHKIWSPDGGTWSPWVKAMLFAHLRFPLSALPPVNLTKEIQDMAWLPYGKAGVALVVDFPGVDSIRIGLELARRGFQPVPIFSSYPPAPGSQYAVDAESILSALVEAGESLSSISIPPPAAPAFLLDARRMPWHTYYLGKLRTAHGERVKEMIFDNCSAVFPADFPTAATLRAHGISRCFVLRNDAVPALGDLRHALLPWKRDGVDIQAVHLDGSPAHWRWPSAGWLSSIFNSLRLSSLQKTSDGGFGRMVSPTSGG